MTRYVCAYGRFNPPTIAHQNLVTAVKHYAIDTLATPLVFTTRSENLSRDPLPFDFKMKMLSKAFFDAQVESKGTIIDVMKYLESLGAQDVVFLFGSDRVNEFRTLLNKCNGKDYSIPHVNCFVFGEQRAANSVSASRLREFATNDDRESFMQYLPSLGLSEQDKEEIYSQVRIICNRKIGRKQRELSEKRLKLVRTRAA